MAIILAALSTVILQAAFAGRLFEAQRHVCAKKSGFRDGEAAAVRLCPKWDAALDLGKCKTTPDPGCQLGAGLTYPSAIPRFAGADLH
jgi:hypothetical protein